MEINFPKIEKKILKFWQKNNIFQKSIEKRRRSPNFVFYEGPPTANAKAGLHHVLSRVFKDIICRHKTMSGFRVLRKAGWDTHGLPVELEIEKKLGLKSKKEIEKYGIAKFNQKCKESVWDYKKDWEKLTERIGFWLDMKNPYITYEADYIETLWWILKEIWQKGLLYQDFKVVPYCPRCIDGNSKILTNPGLSKSVKELKNCWKENRVVALDAKNNRMTTASINEFITLRKEPTLKLSTVETQRSIIATLDHPFWVKGKGWMPLEKINIGDKVAVYPYFEISEDNSENKKILDRKNLQNIITNIELKRGKKRVGKDTIHYRNLITTDKWKIDKKIKAFRKKGYTFRDVQKKILSSYRVKISFNTIRSVSKAKKRSRTLDYAVQELKNKGLLPLTNKNSKLPIITRLLGHLFGDGYLTLSLGKRIKLAVGFTGKEVDLKEIMKDLDEIGVSYEPIQRRFAKSILKDRTIQGYSTGFRTSSMPLATLLIALGAPIGKKSETCFEVPKWLFRAPKHIIREFLASYFGSELNKIKIYRKRTFDALRFSLNKEENLIKNGVHFVKGISKLLKKFDVEIKGIRFGSPFIKKNGKKSLKIRVIFPGSHDNLLNFCKFIGYRYSKERENFALYVREYLEFRKKLEKEKIQKYQTIMKLRKKGLSSKGISQTLNIKAERINEILNRKSKKDIRIWNIPEFKNWLKNATEGLPDGAVWETVGRIEKKGKRDVFDLNIDRFHSFIVNSFITHNCGTSLSSHEVAQGYEKIKEPAIYLKFRILNPGFKNTSLLIWTTTPWTLPGNVAVAVNPNFTYVEVKINEEILILAKERMADSRIKGEIIKEFKGKDLVGLRYESLYPASEEISKTGYRVIPGSFVSFEEGTGLVHIAPAFGEEDMEVGKENNLPILLTVNEEGKFNLDVKKWAGMFVKDADPKIIEDLKERNLLFKEELYEHDYPFCWRCHTPLLYYTKKSWFIKMTKVKKDLIKNNKKINWIPAYLKEGRFGEWLREIKDWAISRERYWGTPLPIWQCKNCKNLELIGSLKEILAQKFSTNNYFILRHGHSLRQVKKIAMCWPEKALWPLTKEGEEEVKTAAKKLKNKKIDLIFSSDLLRAKQTAEILSKELGVKVIFDKRIREYNVGIFNGQDPKLAWDYLAKKKDRILAKIPKGESLADIQKRMYIFLEQINENYQGKNIVILSHELPLSILEGTIIGLSLEKILEKRRKRKIKVIETGKFRKIEFKNLPLNEKMELDFHRPYVDEIKFYCKNCGDLMERTPEVIDCWFDSGAMPFAQNHWPFAQSQKYSPPKLFPADFISEGIDQTRGWFYTLLAISTLLDFGPPYKNVVSLGHVLDEKGEKMSKSKGNVIDPWYIAEKYGADSTRWYFYTINQPGDSKSFSEKDVDSTLKKFILTLWNSYLFYQTYAIPYFLRSWKTGYRNILDRWIISRLNGLIQKTTEKLDKYDVTEAARAIENFVVNDLSLWYIRRSRRRFQKPKDKKELGEASATLKYVLLILSKLADPFIPFLSEAIYQKCSSPDVEHSVHLEDWPKLNKKLINKKLEEKMEKVREIVSLALAERVKIKIKVRQPLSKLKIKKLKIDKELLELIKEEVNVKEVVFDQKIKKEVELDTKITPELKKEGIVREVIRQIQEMRKKLGLKPRHKILVQYSSSLNLNKILIEQKSIILKETKAQDFISVFHPKEKFKIEKEIKVDGEKLYLAIKKV